MSGEVVKSLSLHKANSIGFTSKYTECMQQKASPTMRIRKWFKTYSQPKSFNLVKFYISLYGRFRLGIFTAWTVEKEFPLYEAMTIPSQSSPIAGIPPETSSFDCAVGIVCKLAFLKSSSLVLDLSI